MEVLNALIRFVGWLAGSLAGIVALLYAAGYLIARAHLHALGISGLVSSDSEFFLQEGSKFFIDITYGTSRVLLVILALFAPFVIAGMALSERPAIRGLVAKARGWGSSLLNKLPATLRTPRFCSSLGYLGAFFLLVLHSGEFFGGYDASLEVSDLLYADSATQANMTGARAIRTAILRGDAIFTDDLFSHLLQGFAFSIVILLIGLRVTDRMRWRVLFAAPFVLNSLICFVSLPFAYGVLKRPKIYPVVSATLADEQTLPEGPLFLLDRPSDGMLVWARGVRRVIWVSGGDLKRIEVGHRKALFGK